MKYPLLLILITLLLGGSTLAQAPASNTARPRTDSGRTRQDSTQHADTTHAATSTAGTDDDFNPGLFLFLLVFLGIVAGAAIVGSMAAALLLLAFFIMGSAGILSLGVLVGFYRRSATAGFKTVLYIGCALGGIALGTGSFYLVNHFFHLHFSYKTVLTAGACGGLLSGLLLGLVIFQLIKLLFRYFKERLAL